MALERRSTAPFSGALYWKPVSRRQNTSVTRKSQEQLLLLLKQQQHSLKLAAARAAHLAPLYYAGRLPRARQLASRLSRTGAET